MESINSVVPFVITSGDENIDKQNTISLNNLKLYSRYYKTHISSGVMPSINDERDLIISYNYRLNKSKLIKIITKFRTDYTKNYIMNLIKDDIKELIRDVIKEYI